MNMIGIAKYYIKQGFNVIPINPATKKPTCKWKAYQSNMLNDSQIYSLFISAKGIAIVTGKLSGVFVIDVDSPDNAIDNYISDSLETPTVSTPSHLHHLYFQYPANQEVRNNQEIQVIKGCDVRGEGGYAIVPPTPGYTFLTSFRDCKVAEAPDKLLQVLNKSVTERYKGVTGSDRKQPNVTERDKNKVSTDVHECPQVSINLEKGHRDSTLYHMAAILKRGGASRSEALQVIEILAKNCKPPFPHQEVEEKIKSVYDSGLPRENSLSQEISEWISITKGDFSITECDKDLLISTKRDKINRRQIFHRLVESGEIERVGNKNGIFRRIEKDENIVDWKNADISKTISVAMPFDIDDYVKLYPKNIVMIAGSSNAGKGHPIGTPILTPTGWKNIEDLKINDKVFTRSGLETKITGIYPRGLQQCFEFVFNDRTSIITDWEHIWQVMSDYHRNKKTTGRGNINYNYNKWTNMETYKILGKYGMGKTKTNLIIPMNEPINYKSKNVILDPYILGVLLGDGCLCKGTIHFSSADQEIVDYIAQRFCVKKLKSKRIKSYDYSIKKMIPIIEKLKLRDKKSFDKFIPNDYLFNSIKVRLQLLRGLMDTDGDICKAGRNASFTTISPVLAKQVAFLVRSLGGKVVETSRHTYYRLNGEKKRGRLSYRLHINMKTYNPFLLTRKAVRYKPNKKINNKKIVEINNVGIKETICISVADKSGLYIAKDFIVTHNTAFLFNIARYNMHKHKIVYFTSEMGAEEVKIRLSGFDCNYEDWNFPIIDRSSNFADVIRPDCINIIDFLEITDNFYAIGGEIKKIFDKLGSGLAFIALQKKKGCELGRGAEFSMEKSRLYLSIDSGELKIVKAKNWAKPEYNPNGMKFKFKLVNGCKFIKN